MVREELAAYGNGLSEKYEILALNKADALDADTINERRQLLAQAAKIAPEDVFVLSGAAGIGVDQIKEVLWRHVVELRRSEVEKDEPHEDAGTWSPI